MKIDKTNPSHWLCLILFGLNVLGAMLLRRFRRRQKKKQIVFYGHKLNGNLLAIHEYLRAHAAAEFDVAFLTMDKAYHRQLLVDGVKSVLATSWKTMCLLSGIDAIISDHGLHVMSILVGHSNIRFFDVWHSIPFKGFDADDFRVQHRYDEVWVASELVRKLYIEKYDFASEKIKVTGYARTDRLINQTDDVPALKERFELNAGDTGKIILFAPTWQQDDAARSIYPFGTPEDIFLQCISDLAVKTHSTVIVRPHLNSGVIDATPYLRVKWLPFATYPDTEALLAVSDVLVCDWSSIAFDWLLLRRPTIFLDVPMPFKKGFSLGPEFRYGELVDSLRTMERALEDVVDKPDAWFARHGRIMESVYDRVYATVADGHAAQRCVERLHRFLA